MAIALLTHGTGFGQNSSGNITLNTIGANFILCASGWYAGITTETSLTDLQSNSFTDGTKQTTGTPTSVRLKYTTAASPNVNAVHAVHYDANNTFIGAGFTSWSGVNAGASVLDTQNGTTAASQATITLPSVTPSEDNCVVITAVTWEDNTSGAVSINGGFTIIDTVAFNSSTNEGYAMAYLVQTTAAAVAPTWNFTNTATTSAATIAVFKGPGGGGGGDTLMGQAML